MGVDVAIERRLERSLTGVEWTLREATVPEDGSLDEDGFETTGLVSLLAGCLVAGCVLLLLVTGLFAAGFASRDDLRTGSETLLLWGIGILRWFLPTSLVGAVLGRRATPVFGLVCWGAWTTLLSGLVAVLTGGLEPALLGRGSFFFSPRRGWVLRVAGAFSDVCLDGIKDLTAVELLMKYRTV